MRQPEVTDVVIFTADPWERVRIFEVIQGDGVEIPLREVFLNGQPVKDAESFPWDRRLDTEVLTQQEAPEAYKNYRRIGQACMSQLVSRPRDLTALITHAVKNTRLSQAEVEIGLRFRIGSGDFEIEDKGSSGVSRLVVSASKGALHREHARQFAASMAQDLKVQSDRIGKIIGHNATDGAYREELVRGMLRAHLPERYHIATGFMFGSSRQIDILIYDRVDYAPYFRSGDLVVVDPEAVRATIEVKTKLDTAGLLSALGQAHATRFAPINGNRVFQGVFGYNGIAEAGLIEALRAFYNGEVDEDGAPRVRRPASEKPKAKAVEASKKKPERQRITALHDPVTAVCVLGQMLLTSEFHPLPSSPSDDTEGPGCAPCYRKVTNTSRRQAEVALFLDRLLDHLQPSYWPKQRHLGFGWLLEVEREIGPPYWIDRTGSWDSAEALKFRDAIANRMTPASASPPSAK